MGKQTEGSAAEEETDVGALDATGVYDVDGEVVLYDTENPLAWIQSDTGVEARANR